MADTEDLSNLSTSVGNPGVNGVKVGETFPEFACPTGRQTADGNAELRRSLDFKPQI